LIGIVAIKFSLSLALKQGSLLATFSKITYFLLLLLATYFAIGNAIQNSLRGKQFWLFLAFADGLWALDQWLYLYYGLGLHIGVPDNSIADPVLFLHVVPLMAAVAALPHRNASERRVYPAILNFLFLLFFWSFLYGCTVLPYQYLFPNATSYALRFDGLYVLENLVLVVAVFFLTLRVRDPWKSIYVNFLIASVLYLLSSTVANLAIDSGGYVNGRLYGLGLSASVCWFVWIPLRARQLTGTDESATRSDGGRDSLASVWAMLAVVMISILIVWQLFRRSENPGRQTLRLVVAVVTLLALASAAFIKEYLDKREMASRIGLAHDRLRLAMESAKSVGWDWDLKSGTDVWFGDLKTVFGIPSDHYVGHENDILSRIHPDDRENVRKALEDARQDHQPFAAECRILWPDGTVRWITTQGKFYYVAIDEPARMLGMAVDVTEKKHAERELRESHEKLLQSTRLQERSVRELILFRALLDQSNDAIQVIEPGTLRFLDVNDRTCLDFGYTREELLSMTVYDIAPGFDEMQRGKVLEQIKESGSAIFERVHRRRDGTTFPVEVTVRQVHLDQTYAIAVARDITDRKRVEARLREYEKALEGLEEMIVVVDREYRYVIANRAFLDFRGQQKEQVVGHLASEILGKEVFETIVKKQLDECLQGKVVTYQLKYTYPKRGERHLFISYFPIEGPNGVDRVVSVLQDITERTRAEEALQRSKAEAQARAEELAVILDAVPGIALISRDPSGTSITGSRATYELLRLPYGANLSMSASEEHRPSNHRIFRDGREIPASELPVQKAAATGREVRDSEVTLQFDDGTSCDVFGNAAPLRDREGKVRGAVGVFVDVSERYRAERSLRLFRMLVDQTNDVIEVVDPETLHFIDFNGRACIDLGYSREELLSMSVYDIDPNVDDALYSKLVHDMQNSGFMILESLHRRKDGSTFPVEVSIKQVRLDKTYFVTVVRDITERKRAEQALKDSQAALARVARIATMGELTASIAHEINQPLAAVATNASASLQWLAVQPPNLAEAREAMESAMREADRASSVIKRIRMLLKKSSPELRPLRVNEVIREVLALSHNELLAGGITVQVRLSPDIPAVVGDRVQLQQVLLNLIVNAIDAMIVVTDRPRTLVVASAEDREGVRIEVEDSGKGLDPKQLNCIFESFFTTKPAGIGMGLSISRSIIEAHGGRLWAIPGSPHGAVFQFILPESDSSA